MWRSTAIVLAILAFSTSAMAVNPNTPFSPKVGMVGRGQAPCTKFQKEYALDHSVEDIYLEWSLGVVTGMNAILEAYKGPSRDIAAISDNDLKFRIRDYCGHHP